MSDRTLPGGGFYRTGLESGGQLDMVGGATLLIGNGEPGAGVDLDMEVDNVSIGDMAVPALVPRFSTGQDGWRAATRRESLLDATRAAATHPGIYALTTGPLIFGMRFITIIRRGRIGAR